MTLSRFSLLPIVVVAFGAARTLPSTPQHRITWSHPAVATSAEAGYRTSATFRELVDAIERTPWTVVVDPGECPASEATECLFAAFLDPSPSLVVHVHVDQRPMATLTASIGGALAQAEGVVVAEQRDAAALLASFADVARRSDGVRARRAILAEMGHPQ